VAGGGSLRGFQKLGVSKLRTSFLFSVRQLQQYYISICIYTYGLLHQYRFLGMNCNPGWRNWGQTVLVRLAEGGLLVARPSLSSGLV